MGAGERFLCGNSQPRQQKVGRRLLSVRRMMGGVGVRFFMISQPRQQPLVKKWFSRVRRVGSVVGVVRIWLVLIGFGLV